jgi:hypothetical protein
MAAAADEVWADWRRRLRHPHFGMSTLFVCQNAFQKLGLRLLPTVRDGFERHLQKNRRAVKGE